MTPLPRRSVAPVVAVIVLACCFGVVSTPDARAATPCTVTGYTPRRVTVGLTPRVVTFEPAVSGCTLAGWSIEGGDYGFYADDVAPEATFSPAGNTGTAAQDVVVSTYDPDFEESVAAYPRSFVLRRATRWDLVNASPEPVRKGRTITIKGRLRVADWTRSTYVGYASRTVVVEFRTKSGSYRRIKTVTTGSGGHLTTTVPATKDGYWRVRYGGNSQAGTSRAPGDYVDVR